MSTGHYHRYPSMIGNATSAPTPPKYLPGRLGITTTARLTPPVCAARPRALRCCAQHRKRLLWGGQRVSLGGGIPGRCPLAIIMPTRTAQHSRSHRGEGEALSRASARTDAAAAIADLARTIRGDGASCRAANPYQALPLPPYKAGSQWCYEATCQRL
jgi:hypothetical protein